MTAEHPDSLRNDVESPLNIFLGSLRGTFPEKLASPISALATHIFFERFGGDISEPDKWAVFYSLVAYEAEGFSTLAAAELYARAYDTERPYRPETKRPEIAANFIININHFIRTTQDPTPEQREWISDRKNTLVDALECVIHFWTDEKHGEGFRQAPRKADDVQELVGEWNPDALARATRYAQVYGIAKELLEDPLKFV